ncbi:MAG: hypothetical protein RLZZ297_994 [Chloroflexota bacterium]|jgi:rhodanese-related sulfurtransferase
MMRLDVDGVLGLLDAGSSTCLLDVRSRSEYADDGHIAGSVNLPLGALLDVPEAYADAAAIVCICAAGQRSAAAARVLRAAGYDAVYDLRGGYAAWHAAGLPVVVSV